MIYGTIKISKILITAIASMLFSTFLCYYLAVKYHEQRKFPHATVTSTACHYPQDIVFRFAMLISSSILVLFLYIVFRWLELQAKRTGFHKLIPKYQYYIALLSMGCYCVTLGTIDGKGIGNYHTPCAILFFVIWVVGIVRLTTYITKLRQWDTSVLSLGSLRIKQIFSVYLIIVWVYCFGMLYGSESPNEQDIYSVIVEWNSVVIYFCWILSFVRQWKQMTLNLSHQIHNVNTNH